MFIVHTSMQKSKKRKPTAKQRELSNSWNELLKKYSAKTVVPKGTRQLSESYSLGIPACRETPKHPSLSSTSGQATKKDSLVYTGNKVKGIGTMHKSNAVPIFSDEEAVDISKMRRG